MEITALLSDSYNETVSDLTSSTPCPADFIKQRASPTPAYRFIQAVPW